MNPSNYIFVGTSGQVAAIDRATGQTLWKNKVKSGFGGSFVTLLAEGNKVYAHTGGELFCLDAASGQILWKNDLPQMGFQLASIATVAGASSPVAAEIQRQMQASAASTAAAT